MGVKATISLYIYIYIYIFLVIRDLYLLILSSLKKSLEASLIAYL
jgi:hypothetical protein